MTQLGEPVPPEVEEIRTMLRQLLEERQFGLIDANTQITGRDFLLKIWRMIAAVPLAIAVVHKGIRPNTRLNIFYELGVAQALGKETVVIKTPGATVPSDFVRTEYITFNRKFASNFRKYLDSLENQADHYETIAHQLERNPILAIDYLRRAFLIKNEESLRRKVQEYLTDAGIQERAKNSVELLLADI